MMDIFTDTSTLDDILSHKDTIDPSHDLVNCNTTTLCKYITHLMIELKAKDIAIKQLNNSFQETIKSLNEKCVDARTYTVENKLESKIAEINEGIAQLHSPESLSNSVTKKLTTLEDTLLDIIEACQASNTTPAVVKTPSIPSEIPQPHINFVNGDDLTTLTSNIASECDFKTSGPSGQYCFYDELHIPAFLRPLIVDIIHSQGDPNTKDEDLDKTTCVTIHKLDKDGMNIEMLSRKDDVGHTPDKDIFILPIGTPGLSINFEHIFYDEQRTHNMDPGTLFCVPPDTQTLWKWAIGRSNTPDGGESYIITVQSINPMNKNSTVIVSDSLSKGIKFGNVNGTTLGSLMPGKNITSYTIKEMPSAITLAAYSNVVIAVGINDLITHQTHPRLLINMLHNKCHLIHRLNEKCKIYLSMVLPTQNRHVNEVIMMYNNFLHELSRKHHNLYIVNNNIFASDEHYLLRSEYIRNIKDPIHINFIAQKQLILNIKDAVLRRSASVQESLKYARATRYNT